MEIKTGYLYHIKDEFFEVIHDEKLMSNHERGKKRPTYFAVKENDILWFIPLSSKVEKYQKIIEHKIAKKGFCDTIIIRDIGGKEHAILFQNAFPTLEKYIDHVHTVNDEPAKVGDAIKEEILKIFKNMLVMKYNRGIDLFFVDIDKIKNQLLNELNETNPNNTQ